MTGARGRIGGGAREGDQSPEDPNAQQQASKREVKRTQSLVRTLEDKIQSLNDTLVNLTGKLDSSETKFSQHDLRLAYLEAKTAALQNENKRLKDRVDQLENDKRVTNLKIDGIKEVEQQNLSDMIIQLASALGFRCQPLDIDLVYRIGKVRPGDRPRPVLVCFKSRAVRDNIYFGRSKLRKKEGWRGEYVNDDVNDSTRKKREGLRAVALLCKVKNVDCKLYADSIIINRRRYNEHQLDTLPAGFKLADAKTITTPKGILFQSEHSFLSSFHEAPFMYEGKIQRTVEHALNGIRAQLGNRTDIAGLIREATTPLEAKRFGKLVPESEEYKKGKDNFMEILHFEKFLENPDLQLKLVQTGEAKLMEATVDDHFGIGRPLNALLLQELTWTGSNVLGKKLEKIRSGFVGE